MRARALVLVALFVGIVTIGGLLSAHTSGVVVPPSYVGETAVPGAGAPKGPTELTATAMTVSPPEVSGTAMILKAFVSAGRHGLSRAQVDFYLGTGSAVSLLCATRAKGTGEARCALDGPVVQAVMSQGFTASYAGDAEHDAATASWSPSGSTTGGPTTTGTGTPLSGTAYTLSGVAAPAP